MSRHSQIYTSYEDRIVQHGEQFDVHYSKDLIRTNISMDLLHILLNHTHQIIENFIVVLLEKSDFLDDNYLNYFDFKPKNVSKLSFSELLELLYKADHLCNTTLRKKELKRPMYTYEFEKRSKKLKEISDAKTVKDLKSITRPKVQSQEDNELLYPHGKSSIPGERVVITKLDKVEVAKNRKVSKNAKILEKNLENSVRRTSITSDNEEDDLNTSRRSKKSDLESSMRRSSVKSTDSAKEFTITSASTAKNASAMSGTVRRTSFIGGGSGESSQKLKSPKKSSEKANLSMSGTLPPPFKPAGKSMGKAIDINQIKDDEGSPSKKDEKFDRSTLTDKENNWLNHHKIGLSKRKAETKIICLNILQSLLNTVRGYDYDKYAPYYDFIEMPQEEVDLIELIKSCNVVEAQLVEYEMGEFVEFFESTPYFTKVDNPPLEALNNLYEEIQKEFDDENMHYDDFINYMNQFTAVLHKVDPLPTNTITTTSELKERKKAVEIREGMVVLNEKGGKGLIIKEEEEDKKYEVYNLQDNETKVYAKEKLKPLTCVELGVIVSINSDGSYNIMYANEFNNNYDTYVDDSLIVNKVKIKPFPDIEKSPYKVGDIAFCDNGYEASEYVIVDIHKDKSGYLYSLCYDNRYIINNVPMKEISQSTTHKVLKNTEGLRFTVGDLVEVNVVGGIILDSLVDLSNGKIIDGKVKLSVSSNSVICSYSYDPLNNSCLKPVASHYNQLLIGESVLFQEAHGNVKDKFSKIHYDLIEYKGRYYWKDERDLLTINNDYIIGDKVIVKINDVYELPGIIMDIQKKHQVNSSYKILLCNGLIMEDLRMKNIKTFDYYSGRKVLYIDEDENKFEIGSMMTLDNCGGYCILLENDNTIVGKISYKNIVLYQNKHLKKGMKVKYGNHEGQICEITCDGNYNIFNSSVGTYSPNINYELIQPDYGNEIEIEEEEEEDIKKQKELMNNLRSLYNIGDKVIYNDECMGEINEINEDCSYNICLDDGSYLEFISNKTIYLMPDYSYENMINISKDEEYHLNEEVEMLLLENNKKYVKGKIHRIIDKKPKKYYTISSRIKNETVYYYNVSSDYLRKPKRSLDDKVYVFSEIQGKKIWCLGKIHRIHTDGTFDIHLSVNNISHHKIPSQYILSDFPQLIEETYEVGDILCYNGYDSPKVCIVKKAYDLMYEIELCQSKEVISDAKESDLSRLFTAGL